MTRTTCAKTSSVPSAVSEDLGELAGSFGCKWTGGSNRSIEVTRRFLMSSIGKSR